MTIATDFHAWLDNANIDTMEEVYALYNSVLEENNHGYFKILRENGKLFLSIECDDNVLLIASDPAKSLFLDLIKKMYMDNTGDIESWYGYQRNMDNPKA